MNGSLGYDLLDWFGEFLKVPSGPMFGEPLWLTDEQARIVLRWYAVDEQGRFVFRRGSVRRPKGWGKALALDTPVPTPGGWSSMNDLVVGDRVFGEDGRTCEVVAKSEVWHGTDCFRVTFSDGEALIASGDHLWTLVGPDGDHRTVDTRSLWLAYTRPEWTLPGDDRYVTAVARWTSVPTVCIEVDNPSSLFLAGRRMVPTHNSPVLAALALAELAGPVVFDGWDADGNPVGRPHGTPWVQIAAVSEDQTDNTYRALYNMLSLGDTADDLGLDLGRSKVMRPEGNGILEPVTAAFGSREGQPITYVVLDETHLWTPRNGGVKLAATLRRNAAKMGGRTFESTNAFRPGDKSVAEATHKASDKGQKGLLYDASEGPWVEDLTDREAFVKSAQFAYGDSSWVALDRIWSDATDQDTTESDARRFYLNQIVAAENDFIPAPLWGDCEGESGWPEKGTRIAAGFDGSRFHDSTAIIGVEVATARQFVVRIWSKPKGDDGWEVPRREVTDTVKMMYEQWDVWFFYCDPPEWESEIAEWRAKHGKGVFAFPTRSRQRMSPALKAYRNAVKTGELSHDGDDEQTEHTLNARLHIDIPPNAEDDPDRHMWTIRKPTSLQKIDGCVTAVLAWSARTAAVDDGALDPPKVYKAVGF